MFMYIYIVVGENICLCAYVVVGEYICLCAYMLLVIIYVMCIYVVVIIYVMCIYVVGEFSYMLLVLNCWCKHVLKYAGVDLLKSHEICFVVVKS